MPRRQCLLARTANVSCFSLLHQGAIREERLVLRFFQSYDGLVEQGETRFCVVKAGTS
jgi:hypothetical protein